jgi:hypothetical protein
MTFMDFLMAVAFAAGFTSLYFAIVFRARIRKWFRGCVPPPAPINFVNGVTMPAVDDPRWRFLTNRPLHSLAAELGPIRAILDKGDHGDSYSYLVVADFRWGDADAQCYAYRVVQATRARHLTDKMEQSREAVRRLGAS